MHLISEALLEGIERVVKLARDLFQCILKLKTNGK